jgi:tetratricopeptide (TPR) repeat protein
LANKKRNISSIFDAKSGSLSPASHRTRDWWPLIFVALGLALLASRILKISEAPIWLSTISDIFGIFSTITGFILLALAGRENSKEIYIKSAEQEQFRKPEFPFHIVQSITELIGILFPEPTGEILLPDRDIPYIARDFLGLEDAFTERGCVLLRGRSKTGKTRLVVELLRRYLRTSPTILVHKRTQGLQVPVFIPDDLPRRNIIVLIDDLHIQAANCKRQNTTVGVVISNILDLFTQYCGNQMGEVRFIGIVRREPECWDQLGYESTKPPWSGIELIDMPDLSRDEARRLATELASMPPKLVLSEKVADNLARTNDGTFYRLVLAFREWRSHPTKSEITSDDVTHLQADLLGTWRHRRHVLIKYEPMYLYIYAALELMQTLGISAYKDLVSILALSLQKKTILQIYGWAVLLQIWINRQTWKFRLSQRLAPFENLRRKLDAQLFRIIIRPLYLLFFTRYRNRSRLQSWPRISRFVYTMIDVILLEFTYLVSFSLISVGVIKIINYLPGVSKVLVGLVFQLFISIFIVVIAKILLERSVSFNNRYLSRFVADLGATEVPMIKNILVPYDLQVEGSAQEFINQAWVLNLMEGGEYITPSYLYGLLDLWRKKANFDEIGWEIAVGVAEILTHLEPWDAHAFRVLGVYLVRTEKYGEALMAFNRAIELNPNYKDAIAQRGLTYSLMKKYDEALFDFNQAIDLDPNHERAIAYRGITYRLMEKYDEALFNFNRAIELNPNNDEAIVQRGRTYRQMEKYDEALSNFNRAIEMDPNNEWAITQRGRTYRQMEKYTEALLDFNRAIDMDPNYASAIAQRGITYTLMEKCDEALFDFNRAIDLDPKLDWAFSERGELYLLTKQFDLAITDFEQACQLNKNEDWYEYGYACAYHAIGEIEKSKRELTRAIQLCQSRIEEKPSNRLIKFNLALYNLAIGKAELSEFLYKNTVSESPSLNDVKGAIRDLKLLESIFNKSSHSEDIRKLLNQYIDTSNLYILQK